MHLELGNCLERTLSDHHGEKDPKLARTIMAMKMVQMIDDGPLNKRGKDVVSEAVLALEDLIHLGFPREARSGE